MGARLPLLRGSKVRPAPNSVHLVDDDFVETFCRYSLATDLAAASSDRLVEGDPRTARRRRRDAGFALLG
jgi:hypothetical protein